MSDFNIDILGNDHKQIALMSDFNNDILKHDKNIDRATFLNSMHSKCLLPYIKTLSRITSCSRTLIDNMEH